MGEPIAAWQCIGCGRIEAPQTCIGVCQDKRVYLVSQQDHQEALDAIQQLIGEVDAMQRVLKRIAFTSPRDGQWETFWQAAQTEARTLLGHQQD
jgi:hypothetical protein